MELPPGFINAFLDSHPGFLTKPRIEFGNYFFSWETKSYGLYSTEVDKFKSFIKKTLPYLGNTMEVLNSVKKNDPSNMVIDRGKLCLFEKCNSTTKFFLEMDSLGSTVFYREEVVTISGRIWNDPGDKSNNYHNSRSSSGSNKIPTTPVDIKELDTDRRNHEVCIGWRLGELLFRR